MHESRRAGSLIPGGGRGSWKDWRKGKGGRWQVRCRRQLPSHTTAARLRSSLLLWRVHAGMLRCADTAGLGRASLLRTPIEPASCPHPAHILPASLLVPPLCARPHVAATPAPSNSNIALHHASSPLRVQPSALWLQAPPFDDVADAARRVGEAAKPP